MRFSHFITAYGYNVFQNSCGKASTQCDNHMSRVRKLPHSTPPEEPKSEELDEELFEQGS